MIPGVNEECEYFNGEKLSCNLIDEENKMPKLTPECNCSECLVALYRARGDKLYLVQSR